MKRLFLLFLFALLISGGDARAQGTLSMSPVYSVSNDTVPAYTFDSLHVWVKNIDTANTFSDYFLLAQAVQDSANTIYHSIDSIGTFAPITLPPGDSIQMTFYNHYDIDSATRYHYDINVIVIWPIAASGVNIGDSLVFTEYVTINSGVQEIDLNELIHAYPNPVSHDLNLKNESGTGIKEVYIYDAGGRLVRSLQNADILCTDDWKAGTYLLQLVTRDNRHCTIRVIKQ